MTSRTLMLFAFVLAACGQGRTALLRGPEPCASEGDQRFCSDGCGEGKQQCQNGQWGPCQVGPVAKACSSSCGTGTRVCKDGVWTECNAPQTKLYALAATLRDFHSTQPDFEDAVSGDCSDPGMVADTLGNDGTPTYARAAGSLTVASPESFAKWYHDVPGANLTVPYEIDLTPSDSRPGYYQFDGRSFFPLDNDPRGFGNEGQTHDYDFTLAATATFDYRGGEWFSFTGDDDLWVFINKRLAVDLGGLHESRSREIYLDDHASELGISAGHAYPLQLFFAERHTISTNLSIETNVTGLRACL